ncbi:MAG: DPP IV N-terminal domain-containing protein [Reichenbachiella sp.]
MRKLPLFILFVLCAVWSQAQDPSKLTLDQIFNSGELIQERLQPISWMSDGAAYVRAEYNEGGSQDLIKYQTANSKKSVLIASNDLIPAGAEEPINIEDFTFSEDESKILIFTNSARVWRSNTKGDYYIYDLASKSLHQIGKSFESSSLMFAKFSIQNNKVAYVQGFNLYVEDLASGETTQLTQDGGDGIINGTFDWVYEEEFGVRDGFQWSPGANQIAFWNLDASKTGTFYMINNTDSIYSQMIPLQYPKVGQDPSACKLGITSLSGQTVKWIPLEGSAIQNYIPSMQWLNKTTLLIQQLNRHQNKLTVWSYNTGTEELKKVYVEKEKTWVDISYPDESASHWGDNTLMIVDNGTSFLRLSENDGWRHIYKINVTTGKKTVLTPGAYDVASVLGKSNKLIYFMASPDNSTQRYLYQVDIKGSGVAKRITPNADSGINGYDISPNGKYAIHTNTAALSASKVNMVTLPAHKLINPLLDNKDFESRVASLDMPAVEFTTVTTEENINIDVRIIKPTSFDVSKKYPVLFHVYGEPWGAVATDSWIGMWNIYLAQQGYVIIDMDNRGTPCLKGSEWRKSIYKKIGVINVNDQGLAAKEILKLEYLDNTRTAVWGWSGGGSMTLGLMFKYPEIYTTGMSVAPVSNQLVYDNIYQERYMGLPQENLENFVNGSPITHAKNLEGNLLLVHGTADDNVHYQSMEMLVNELILQNKQFSMMSYPNRSHGIYEGENTRRHLFTLLTNYLMTNVPVNN